MPGIVGLVALTVSFIGAAQETDNRPIYYVMLKSLEEGFASYNDELVAALDARLSSLHARFEPERQAIAEAAKTLEAERATREAAFNTKRDALNERIDAINTQIALRTGRVNEKRRIEKRHAARYASDPEITALMERIAAQIAEIDTIRNRYLSQVAATQRARAALTRQFEEYMSAGDPLALEIRSLQQDLQRFAERERRKLKELADDYAVEYAAYNEWLEGERAILERLRDAVASAVETDRGQRALHAKIETELRGLIDEYNALVEVHNKAPPDDPARDGRALKFSSLEEQIGELQSDLAEAREAVVKADEGFEEGTRQYNERYMQFESEKREREAELAKALAEINDARVAVETYIDARREKVDAQIKTLEAQISDELEDARNDLESLSRRLIEDFGHDHEGLDVAIKRVLEENDEGLLYSASGAPRFDLSRPKTATVYKAVERVLADRRKIDARIAALEDRAGDTPRTTDGQALEPPALEGERAALSAERQQLLEAHATFARDYQARVVALEQRRQSIEARFSNERALLRELFAARAELTRFEFEAVQQVLVATIRGLQEKSSGPDEHSQLLSALRDKAERVRDPVDASLLAPNALLDRIAPELPPGSAPDASWQPFASHKVIDSRTLSGGSKAAVASAWLARLRRQRQFEEVADELAASGAVTNATEALSNLFLSGVMQHATIVEQRLDGGGVGIQVGILGRDYQLDANGSLARLPGA